MLPVSNAFSAAERADVNQVASKIYLILGNYAASASVSASSSDGSGNYPASGAIDGDRTEINVGAASTADNGIGLSSWRSATAPSVTPQTLTVDMGASRTINRIKLYHLSSHGLKSYKLESSPDNSTWTLIAKTTDQGGTIATTHELDTVDFDDATCRYVRLTIDDTVVAADKANVVEIEIYRLVDITGRVLSAEVDRSRDYKLGNPLASTLQIVGTNNDRFFSFDYTPTSAEVASGFINSELAPNIGVIAEYGFKYGGAEGETAQQFIGYVDSIHLTPANRTATIQARDGMKPLFNETVSSNLKTSVDLSAAIQYALNLANVSDWEMSLDSTGITLDYFFINDDSIINVVRDLVQGAGDAVFYYDESGIAVFKTFLGNTPQSRVESTEADFEAGTVLTNIDTTSTPDQFSRKWFLIDDFSDGDFTSNPVWTSRTAQGQKVESGFASWSSGTVKTNINTNEADSTTAILERATFLIDDFSDGNYTTNPAWTVQTGNRDSFGSPANKWSVAGSRLTYSPASTGNVGRAHTSFTPAYGSWQIAMRTNFSFLPPQGTYSKFWIMANLRFTDFGPYQELFNGYYLQAEPDSSGANNIIRLSLWRSDFGSSDSQIATTDIIVSNSSLTAEHTYEVRRTSDGSFAVLFDGTFKLTGSDTGYTTSVYLGAEAYSTTSDGVFSYGNILYSTDGANGVGTNTQSVFESDVIDQGANVSSEGILDSVNTTPTDSNGNHTSLTFFTATSADGVTFDPYVAVVPGNFIQSTTRRYIKYKILFSCPVDSGSNNADIVTPTVTSVTINWVDIGWQCVTNAIQYSPLASNLIAGIDLMFTITVGTWRANMLLHNGSGAGMKARMYIMTTGYDIPSATYLSGYYAELDQAAGKIRICKIDASAARTVLVEATQAINTSAHSVRLTRTSAGVMNLYWNDAFAATATDTSFNSNAALAFEVDPNTDTNGFATVDDVNFTNTIDGTGTIATTQSIFESDVIDMTAGITMLGLFQSNFVTPTGTNLSFFTATSSDGTTFDAYVAVIPGNNIASALKRYLKYKVVLTCPIDNGIKGTTTTPVITDVTINWTTGAGSPKYPTTVSYVYKDTTTLLALEREITDILGGDTAILNDVIVQAQPLILSGANTDTQWQGTTGSPPQAISVSNPLNVTNGQTLIYAIVLGSGMDTSLMSGADPAAAAIVFGGSGAGSWTITQINPTQPVLQIVITGSGTITDLRLVGKAFTNSNTVAAQEAIDAASIKQYGDRQLSLSNPYIVNSGIALSIATRLISNYKNAISYVPACTVRPSFAAQLGDRVTISDTNTGLTDDFIIVGISHTFSASVDSGSAQTDLTLLAVLS